MNQQTPNRSVAMDRPIACFARGSFDIAQTTAMIHVAKACRDRFDPVFDGTEKQTRPLNSVAADPPLRARFGTPAAPATSRMPTLA